MANAKSNEVILRVENLQKTYGDKKAVDGISFEVKKGEIFGILGPNGAGKTTTLEMIETLREIDGGSASIDGVDVAKNPYKIRSMIGVQPQTPGFQDKTKLTELIQMFAAAYGERVNPKKFLDEVNLGEILTTHYMDEAEVLCDRIAIMDRGKIVELDTPKNLIKALLARGFKKEQTVQQANLEDVFIDLTGKALRS
jgi:ABC-2 type transport system ATP-binding protein